MRKYVVNTGIREAVAKLNAVKNVTGVIALAAVFTSAPFYLVFVARFVPVAFSDIMTQYGDRAYAAWSIGLIILGLAAIVSVVAILRSVVVELCLRKEIRSGEILRLNRILVDARRREAKRNKQKLPRRLDMSTLYRWHLEATLGRRNHNAVVPPPTK
jgi:hypothetical protein